MSFSSADIASPHDVERVTALLGRRPQGDFSVVLRDAVGDPRVVRNAPLLHDGTPMPTRYWLVDPADVMPSNMGRLSLPFNSINSRSAVFLPTPGTNVSEATSPLATMSVRARGECVARIAIAIDGPMP